MNTNDKSALLFHFETSVPYLFARIVMSIKNQLKNLIDCTKVTPWSHEPHASVELAANARHLKKNEKY